MQVAFKSFAMWREIIFCAAYLGITQELKRFRKPSNIFNEQGFKYKTISSAPYSKKNSKRKKQFFLRLEAQQSKTSFSTTAHSQQIRVRK